MSESHSHHSSAATELPALTAHGPIPASPVRRPPHSLSLWLSIAALLGGLIALGLTWQNRERLETTRQELSRRLADGDATQREALVGARQNREALDALQAKVGGLESKLAEMQSQQMALETMYQELSRVRDDRLIAEIEQAVSIAAQQLQLAGNVEAALIALQGAEARLAKNGQPQFLSLRKLISRDIERLKSLPGADVPGIALRIDSLLNAVPSLPLAFEQRPQPAKPGSTKASEGATAATQPAEKHGNTWQAMATAWFAELWQELRQLVRIERIDRPDPGLLAPREVFFLRENLRLRLLSARLALLARDGRTFQGDIRQSAAWLEQYFDLRATAVADARQELLALAKLDVMRETAELNETLAALRNVKLVRDRSPAR